MVVYRVNGKRYEVPDEDSNAFRKYIKEVWEAYPKTMQFDRSTPTGFVTKSVHTPASLKSQSFTYELNLWAERNWERYVRRT